MEIRNNSSLTSLAGLGNLSSIEIQLLIVDNDNLTSIAALQNLSAAKNIRIGANPSLTSLTGLGNLINVERQFKIDNNSLLTDFCSLRQELIVNLLFDYYTVTGNAHNPSIQDLINGNCSL